MTTPPPPTPGTPHPPHALRNRVPIAAKILELLAATTTTSPTLFKGKVLEISSGTGALLEHLSQDLPNANFQATEYVPGFDSNDSQSPPPPPPTQKQLDTFSLYGKGSPLKDVGFKELDALNSVMNAAAPGRFSPAKHVDLTTPPERWDSELTKKKYDAIHCGNTLHIAPYPACALNLLAAARMMLVDDGLLTVYGPFTRNGKFTTPSNAEFDSMLRSRNPNFGLRDADEFVRLATDRFGFASMGVFDMPANNFLIALQKRGKKETKL